jgi:hypothetical protein
VPIVVKVKRAAIAKVPREASHVGVDDARNTSRVLDKERIDIDSTDGLTCRRARPISCFAIKGG